MQETAKKAPSIKKITPLKSKKKMAILQRL